MNEAENRWRKEPKIELHAHLGGCVRLSTLTELARERGQPIPEQKPRSTLNECFEIFRAIHDAVDSIEAVERMAREAVSDFAADGVRYVELRTTPRAMARSRSTAREYMEAVIKAIGDEIAERSLEIDVGVVVSVDRAKGKDSAMANAVLARDVAAMPSPLRVRVSGVELSGNPHVGNWDDMRAALDFARTQARLPVSVHIAEVARPTETLSMLEWEPQRLGHAVFVDSEATDLIITKRIPVEVCLTSNVFSRSITAPSDHPFVRLRKSVGHPIVFCTDDFGVFDTSVSKELAIAEVKCGFTASEIRAASLEAVEFSFASESIKSELRKAMKSPAVQNATQD